MAKSNEIELKLALVKGRASKAKQAVGRVRFERTAIDDIYFDTPARDLRRRGLVLRVRRDGERWMQTLKAAPAQHSLVPERGEWEVPLPAGERAPPLDLERFDITPLRVLMRAGLDPDTLAPVFRSRITRRRGTLAHGDSEVEIALDRGELRARVDGRRRRQPVSELEVELKSGRPEDVLAIATDIVRRARGVTLVPAMRTKSERGYALSSDSVLEVARASARGFAQQIGADASAPEALRGVMRHGLAIVVANSDAVRQAPAAEHVHQARVALRRIRSAIRLLDPSTRDLPPSLLAELQWLARVMGRVRDWDVICDDTLPAILAAADLDESARRRLHRESRRRRARALARAVDAVSSRRYARLVLQAAGFAMSPTASGANDAAEVPAAALLDEAAGRLFKGMRGFSKLSSHERHRVRIHAKRLRYALDLFLVRLPERGGSDYVAALASLQDSLGALNDASVAVERLRELARTAEEVRALEAWLERTERELLGVAGRQLTALARRSRPWSGHTHT